MNFLRKNDPRDREGAAPADDSVRRLLQQSLTTIERLERDLAEARRPARAEALAIIGLGCRLPGADGPAAFWNLLAGGVDAIEPIPADRWDASAFAASRPGERGRIATGMGGFVPNLREFDADFFGIAPREAVTLDPQQRLLLEVTWEAIEHAGLDAAALLGSRAGVFLGICGNDYQHLQMRRALTDVDAYLCSGTCHSTAAGRVSYWLGLKGPSLAIDTACSSSLVALHVAGRSLADRECDLAFVGGVNRIVSPQVHVNFSQAAMLSPDGRCKAFDAAADGFVRAEGCGVLVLKRLADAVRDGDRVLATVLGSAVNQDGRSSGLTVPNGPSQQAVIREALVHAGVATADVDYVEAHGTGTALGDPIEMESLTEVFGASHAERPLWVGSVKTNIGHLEAAAGVAAVIKVVLALNAERIPAHLHFHCPSPHIDWNRAPVQIPTAIAPWQGRSGRRIAGVSSFGFSGTNAHVILAQAEAAAPATAAPVPHVLVVSARSREALDELRAAYATRLDAADADVSALCATAATRRTALPWRLAVTAADRLALRHRLIEAELPSAPARQKARVAFVFSGQGTQHGAMACALAAALPSFGRHLRALAALAPSPLGAMLADLLLGDVDDRAALSDTRVAQPALCLLQLALVRSWRDLGVEPAVVIGHSVGEIAAAGAAGALSEAQALAFAAARGAAMSRPDLRGGMVAIAAARDVVDDLLSRYPELALAASNAGDQLVLSGGVSAVGRLQAELVARAILHHRLDTEWAFHSPAVDAALPEIAAAAAALSWQAPRITWISTLTGGRVSDEPRHVEYWTDQARRTVRFAAAIGALHPGEVDAIVEIGPGRTLLGLAGRTLGASAPPCLASLGGARRSDDVPLPESLARLSALGVAVRWEGYFGRGPLATDLPRHPFHRQRYWIAETERPELPDFDATLQAAGLTAVAVGEQETLRRFYRALHRGTSSTAPGEDIRFRLDWMPSAGPDVPVARLPEPRVIGEGMARGIAADREAAERLEVYRRYEAELEAVACDAVIDVWRGAGLADGRVHDLDACGQALRALPKYRPLVSHLAQQLVAAGQLERVAGGWVASARGAANEGRRFAETADALARQWGDRVELRLLRRCAGPLAEVLRGNADPVRLLFPNGDMSDVTQLYREGPVLRSLNEAMRGALSAVVEPLPRGRRLRVVELGAGTGGTTTHVLPALPDDRCEYWFTDVSGAFVERARRELQAHAGMSYAVVDVERPASDFALPAADVVIAANVLHATRDIAASVRHARERLKPGGYLMLVEGVRAQSWVDLTFGLTDGWWAFRGDARRRDYPLLSETAWLALLRETGFDAAFSVAPFDDAAQRVFVARRAAEPRAGASYRIASRDAGLKAAVEEAFAVAGQHVAGVDGDAPHDSLAAVVYALGDAGLDDVQTICADLLALARSDRDVAADRRPPLVLLTRTSMGGTALKECAAAMTRVIGLERGHAGTRRLHVDGDDPVRLVTAVEEIVHGVDRDVCWSPRGREVLRLLPDSSPLPTPPALDARGTYLVTGGLGGAGLALARWLGLCGARRLVLVGRTAVESDAQRDALRDLAAAGVDVEVHALDIAEPGATHDLVATLRRDAVRPLRGVLHLAGVIGAPTPAEALTDEACAAVLAPKALGALHLHRACEGAGLDFFVCFSSGAAAWGFKGQAHYAAANAFMDGLVEMRRAHGLAGSVVDWGYLAAGGMTADAESRAVLERFGVGALSVDEIGAVVGAAIAGERGRIVAARNDWAKLRALFATAGEESLFDALVPDAAGEHRADASSLEPAARMDAAPAALRERLARTGAPKRAACLEDALVCELAEVLGRERTARIRCEDGFQALGVDSLMALDLRARVERLTGCALPATMIYELPNVRALAAHLLPQLIADAPIAVTDAVPSVETASVDELERLLQQELEGLSR